MDVGIASQPELRCQIVTFFVSQKNYEFALQGSKALNRKLWENYAYYLTYLEI